MKLKKMLLLASMALAAIAFAAPAAAQALEFNEATESYEGVLAFSTESPAPGSFECEVTVSIVSEGGNTAEVEEFTPTTSTCVGKGLFTGCVLKAHSSSEPFIGHITGSDITVTDEPGNIVIHNEYEKCAFGITETNLEFQSVTAIPTPATGPIHELDISGLSTSKTVIASGSVTAEDGEALEIN
jgi:hypothetical protein